MSGIHEIELPPLPLSRFCRHIRQIVYFEMPGESSKKSVNSSLSGLEIVGNSL